MRFTAFVLGALALVSTCRADILYTFTVDIGDQSWREPAPTFSFQTPVFLTPPFSNAPIGTLTCSPGNWERDAGGCYQAGFLPDSTHPDTYSQAFIGIWSTFNPVIWLRAAFPNSDLQQFGTFEGVDFGFDNVTGTLTVTDPPSAPQSDPVSTAPEPSTLGLLALGFVPLFFARRRINGRSCRT